jgi:DNA-binding IclR family transcriptional regulator
MDTTEWAVKTVTPAADAGVKPQEPSRRRTGSVRALSLLDAFAGSRSVLGVSELAARAGVPKSTAHRLLAMLIDSGYVKRAGDRYCLAEHAFEMGNMLWACRPGGLRERAIPFMIELSQQTQSTVHLAILDGDSVLYLEKLFVHNSTPCPTSVGSRRPAHCTALGKALLAHSTTSRTEQFLSARLTRFTPRTRVTREALATDLDRARSDRVATESEEYRLGLSCVAAPILNRETGVAVGALSISTTPDRVRLHRFAAQVLRAAELLGSRSSIGTVRASLIQPPR